MTARRSRLGIALLALAPGTTIAAGAGCGGTELGTTEPSAEERAATTAALLDQLSLEGAVLDDSPSVHLLSASPSWTSPSSTRIAVTSAPVPRPLDKVLRAWGTEIPRSCATVEGASPDADADGIPATASVQLHCAAAAYDVSGSAFLIDDDDRDPTDGFALGLRDLRVKTATDGGLVTRTADASFLVTVRPDPRPGAVDTKLNVRVERTRGASNGAITQASFESSGTTSYLPDADLTPMTRSQHGLVTSTVHTTITFAGAAHVWTRRATLSLHWNLACKAESSSLTGFDGGAAVYTDDRGNTLRIDFTSCESQTVTLNGHS